MGAGEALGRLASVSICIYVYVCIYIYIYTCIYVHIISMYTVHMYIYKYTEDLESWRGAGSAARIEHGRSSGAHGLSLNAAGERGSRSGSACYC